MPVAKNVLRIAVLFSLLALLITAVPAGAYNPADSFNDRYEVRLPDYRGHAAKDYGSLTAGSVATDRLKARYNDTWRVHAWNGQTGTAHWAFGSDLSRAGAITSATQLEQRARQIVAENYDVLGAENESLVLSATPRGMGKWAAHLQQTWNGYEVWQSKVRMVFHENGNLMLMGSDYHKNIDLDPRPSLSQGAAVDAAVRDLPYEPGRGDAYQVDAELLVLPVPMSETDVQYHLVYRVRVNTAEPLGEWVTHVDAHNGEVVWRYNDIHFDFEGSASSDHQPHTYCNPNEVGPARYLDVSVTGLGSTTTDGDGNWAIAGGGATGTVTATLTGEYVTIYNFLGAEAAFSGAASAGVPFSIEWTDANSRQDERDVYDAMSRVHDFFEEFDPGFGYSNTPIDAYINRNDGYCPGNAWWNGTINFCSAGGSYGNTGEIQQVVEHEFGHGVQDYILGSQGNEGLGEGNSDILGNLITQDHIIGKGFYVGNCTSGIRDVLNTLQYPEDLDGSVHHDGQIISGFNWDAMVLLQAQYGMEQGTLMSAERWHFGRVLLHPVYQDDQVMATYTADDDNGNLADGTPNHGIFFEADQNHGYDVVPEVGMYVLHDGAPYQTSSVLPIPVTCTAVSLGAGEVDPSSFVLYYRVDGGAFTTTAMTANSGEYTAVVPGQPLGSVVEYYITASNTLGDSSTSPENAPVSLHYLAVDTQFAEEAEFDTAWIMGAAGDNAGTGLWERGVPVGTNTSGVVVQLGADHTPDPGVACFVTGAAGGSSAGTYDVDGGRTTLLSPSFNLAGGQNVEISYWRYYTNNTGNAPNSDYWRVDISNDGGQNWSSVENTTASDTAWQQVVISLSDYFATPGVVQLRFIADDAGDGSLVEAMVDDFVLVGDFLDPTPVDDAPELQLSFGLKQNMPNPFNPSTKVSFSLDRSGPASLRVFDARGLLVKTLVADDLPAGPHSVTWNGDDERGRPVASGVYFYKLDASGQTAGRRMLLVK